MCNSGASDPEATKHQKTKAYGKRVFSSNYEKSGGKRAKATMIIIEKLILSSKWSFFDKVTKRQIINDMTKRQGMEYYLLLVTGFYGSLVVAKNEKEF